MTPAERAILPPPAGPPVSSSPLPCSPREIPNRPLFFGVAMVLATAIVIFDLSFPTGVAGGVPFVALVILARWAQSRTWIYSFAFLSSVLTLVDFFLHPLPDAPWIEVANRILALFSIWITALLLSLTSKTEQALQNSEANLRLQFQTMEDHTRHLEICDHIAKAAGSNLEPERLFRVIVQEIRRFVQCDRCLIATLDIEKNQYYLWHHETDIPVSSMNRENIPYNDWWAAMVYGNNQVFYSADLSQLSHQRAKEMVKAGYRALYIVPILQDNRCIAHLALVSSHENAFPPKDRALLVSATSHLGSAIRNAMLYQASEERAQRLEIVGQIAKAVGSTLEPNELFERIAQQIRSAISCERCAIGSVRNGVRHNFHIESEIEVPPSNPQDLSQMVEWVQEVYEKKETINYGDISRVPSPRAQTLYQAGFKSILAVPIIQDDMCIGHFVLGSTIQNAFKTQDEELLTSIADHMGPAIRNVTLYRESEKRASHLAISSEIAKAVSSKLNPDGVFRTVVQEIRRVVPCDRCLISIADRDRSVYRHLFIESDLEIKNPLPQEFKHRWWLEDVYEKKQPVRIADYGEIDSFYAQALADSGICSGLLLPILQDGECIAHIGILRKDANSFTDEEEELLASITKHLGPAIRNATLYEESQNYTVQLSLLRELSHELSSKTDLSSIFDLIGRVGQEIIHADRCAIWEMDSEGVQKCVWRLGVSDDFVKTVENHDEFRTAHTVVREAKPVFIFDAQLEQRTAPLHDAICKEGNRSALHLPLRGIGRGFGMVSYYFDDLVALGDRLIDTAQTFADQAAAAIEKNRLYEESRRRADRLEVLNFVIRKIGENLDFQDVLSRITDAAIELFKGDYARILFASESSDELVHGSHSGNIKPSDPDRMKIGDSVSGQVILSGKPKLIAHLSRLNDRVYSEWAKKHNLNSCIEYPVTKDGKVIGVISCLSHHENFFTGEDMKLLGALASQASIAIENASLYEESEKKGKRLAALVDITQQLTRKLELSNVLQSISQATATLFEGEAGFRLLQGNQLIRKGATPGALQQMVQEKVSLGTPIAGLVAQTGEAFITANAAEDPRIAPDIRAREEFQSTGATLSVPLIAGARILGTLGIFRERGYIFKDEEVRLATSLADQAAVAIENASLLAEAKRSRDFFRSVVDDNADAIYVTDKERRVFIWNNGAEKLYGYVESETIGQSIGNLIIPYNRKEEWLNSRDHEMNSFFQKGKPSFIETTHRKKDGSQIAVQVTRSPIRNENGEVVAICAVCKDLSERKLAEEAIRHSEEKFRHLVEFAGDGIFVHDLQGNLFDVNQQACESLGYYREELLQLNLREIEMKFDQIASLQFHSTYPFGEPKTFEGIQRRKDGSTFPAESRLGKFELNGRELIVTLVRDISERKESEERLLEAMKRAEAASRAKSEFLSTMSHELRSPLNAVIGFSELLLEDLMNKDEATRKLVPKIRDSGKHLLSIIEDLLDHDRIEWGKVSLKLEPTSINDLVTEAVDTWQPRLPGGYHLLCELDPSCGSVSCDSTRIGQILNNLIDNAVKYSPDGGTIRIATQARAEEIRVCVQDQGMGISIEAQETIFERFQQLERGYTRRAGGLGIGLALVRKLLDMHGGRIWVDSREGQGSTFTFSLPRNPAEDNNQAPRPRSIAAADGAEPWAGRNVLIVDDVDHYHEYMRILMKSAARLASAHDGLEAIEAARNEQPDFILMDLRMPKLDGFEAIRKLKFDPATRDIPIIAVTAQAIDEDRKRAAQAGANGFVTKPIDIEPLKNAIAKALAIQV